MISTTSLEAGRKNRYDEDLLVRLVAEGQLSCRKIAQKVGVSAMTVSNVARGRHRRDLFERIRRTVELSGDLSAVGLPKAEALAKTQAAHRRAHRLAMNVLWPLVAPHVKEALEGTGQAAQDCREFLIRTFITCPDPAAWYVGGPEKQGSNR